MQHKNKSENKTGIFLITGIMAAGKSTIAHLLSERLEKSVHIRGDIFRKMIINGRVEMSNPPSKEALEQLILRHKLTAQVSDEYFQSGFNVVIQDVIIGPRLQEMVEFIQNRPLYIIVLTPSSKVVSEREASRPKTGYGSMDIDFFQDTLQNKTPRIGLWIDSSSQAPNETVDAILERVFEEAKIL